MALGQELDDAFAFERESDGIRAHHVEVHQLAVRRGSHFLRVKGDARAGLILGCELGLELLDPLGAVGDGRVTIPASFSLGDEIPLKA